MVDILGISPGIPPIDMGGVPNVSDPNILMAVLDDAATTEFKPYGQDPNDNYARVATMEYMAKRGVMFRNSYSCPLCSPTRAALWTGRKSRIIGQGDLCDAQNRPLSIEEIALPRMIHEGTQGRYACACIGKLHLANDASRMPPAHFPINAGFDYYAGSLANFERRREDYYRWMRTEATKTERGPVASEEWCTTYAPTQNVDDALRWIGAQTKPWFLLLNFNVPHSPFQLPPPHLHDGTNVDNYRAMIQAGDREFGRLLSSLPNATFANTHFVYWSDNGTPSGKVLAPFQGSHGKRTVYQQGVNVPLVWMGPGVDSPGRETEILVQVQDFYATFADILDIDLAALYPGVAFDGITFAPHLQNRLAAGLRAYAYTEAFSPNVPYSAGTVSGPKMIRDTQYKFIRDVFATDITFPWALDQLYDLTADPFETNDLLVSGTTVNLSMAEMTAYNALTAQFVLVQTT